MKNYRNHKGEFITKRQHEARLLRKLYVALTGLGIAVVFGIVGSATHTVEYHAPHAEASAPVPDWDICGLNAVICEQEKPIDTAVTAISEAIGHRVTDETVRRVTYLYEKATEAGVPFNDAVKTIWCESMWISQKSHLPEESYGLSQVHIPSHKVSPETALDAYWSIDFLVEHWYTKQAVADNMWYGYSRATGSCTNGLTINL